VEVEAQLFEAMVVSWYTAKRHTWLDQEGIYDPERVRRAKTYGGLKNRRALRIESFGDDATGQFPEVARPQADRSRKACLLGR
jgi:hypothetical protein